jgi:hypothetical protein
MFLGGLYPLFKTISFETQREIEFQIRLAPGEKR